MFLVLVFSALACVFAGCKPATPENDDSQPQKTVEVCDMTGIKRVVPKNPQRIAVASRAAYDLLLAAGVTESIDGIYKSLLKNNYLSYFDSQADRYFSYEYSPNIELLYERKVDLAIVFEEGIAESLIKRGIPAFVINTYLHFPADDPTNYDNLLTYPRLIKQLFDDPQVIEKMDYLINALETVIADVKAKIAGKESNKSVYYIRGDKNRGINYTENASSFTNFTYNLLGFNFVGAQLKTNKPQTEEIIKQNPDIFVAGGVYQKTHIEQLKSEAPYKDLEAVKNGHIYNIPLALVPFEQPSAFASAFIQDQANKLRPDLFNYDIEKTIRDIAHKIFGKDISDEVLSKILNGETLE